MSTNGHNPRQTLPTLPAHAAVPATPTPPTPPPLPPVDWALPQEEPLAEVERQMERGSQFTQAALDKLVGRLAGAEAYIIELVDLLRARGILSDADLADEDEEGPVPSREPEALVAWQEPPSDGDTGGEAVVAGSSTTPSAAAAAEDDGRAPQHGTAGVGTAAPEASEHGDAVLSESGTQARVTWPGIAFRVDEDHPAPPVAVNCDERMHVCHAVCCKLNFALTPEEVDGGQVKWDLGFPYMIRHGANGYCSHNDTATGRCTNYANRPGVCHRYSCANDSRIWKDFDNMVLNEEWIRANLANQSRIVVGRALPLMEVKHGKESNGGRATP